MIKRIQYVHLDVRSRSLSLRRGSVDDPQRTYRMYHNVSGASAWRLARAINRNPRFYIQVGGSGYMACIPGV